MMETLANFTLYPMKVMTRLMSGCVSAVFNVVAKMHDVFGLAWILDRKSNESQRRNRCPSCSSEIFLPFHLPLLGQMRALVVSFPEDSAFISVSSNSTSIPSVACTGQFQYKCALMSWCACGTGLGRLKHCNVGIDLMG
jgi:hypothetical protein